MFKFMKNHQLTEKQARGIIAERLSLQSVRRALWDQYSLKNNTLDYLESPEFAQVFNSWHEKKRENFLKEIGGNCQWVLAKNINRAAESVS